MSFVYCLEVVYPPASGSSGYHQFHGKRKFCRPIPAKLLGPDDLFDDRQNELLTEILGDVYARDVQVLSAMDTLASALSPELKAKFKEVIRASVDTKGFPVGLTLEFHDDLEAVKPGLAHKATPKR